jgi:hypothetical protein
VNGAYLLDQGRDAVILPPVTRLALPNSPLVELTPFAARSTPWQTNTFEQRLQKLEGASK